MTHASDRLDDNGFLNDPFDWNEQIAAEIAARIGVGPLGERHKRMLSAYRRHYFWGRSVPPAKIICHELDFSEDCIDDLFGGPLNTWRIAGLPDPGEEARVYLDNQQAFGSAADNER